MNELTRNIDQSHFKARSGAVGGVYSEWLKLEIINDPNILSAKIKKKRALRSIGWVTPYRNRFIVKLVSVDS
ncbi:hypothetical protein QD47_05520 [Paenibacillus terrae]|uniref:Uncharacterized protein n=1 Tax=Paenibacillus terrae TaxID=159743 RepID=A0A0D7X5P2_9BACL|nr:hypothetical protein QD47_05520 [Paenibacillus terrae]